MPRYRLRFLLQEFDLTGPTVLIGRSPACDITIEDPLISREHARIELDGDAPCIVDLRSRNGVVLNDQPVIHRATLQHGDRLRLGTRQLVFIASGARRESRTTSAMTFCASCDTPFPSRAPRCPHCGATRELAGDTTAIKDIVKTGWTFGLLCDVVERALDQGRYADAERMLKRGVRELETQIREGKEIDPAHVYGIADCASRLGSALQNRRWGLRGQRLFAYVGAKYPSTAPSRTGER